jgi:hypothetical protein
VWVTKTPDAEFDTEPQWSEDGNHWWDGQQWLEAEEARARSAQTLAMSGQRAAYLPPVELPKPPRNTRLLVSIAGGVVLVAFATVLLLVLRNSGAPDDAGPVKQTLRSAFAAEKAFHAQKKTYTASHDGLMTAGYKPLPGVTLSIIRADRRSYCLQAGKGTALMYLASDVSTAEPKISSTPCV